MSGTPGKVNDFKADIQIKENAKPIFCKARPVPYSLKQEVEKQLDKMEADGKLLVLKEATGQHQWWLYQRQMEQFVSAVITK